MTADKTETSSKIVEIPVFIKAGLIFVASAINLPILFQGFNLENIVAFTLFVAKNLILVPGLFLIIGLLIRLSNNTFKLSNAYYLGVFTAVILALQGLKGM